MAGKTTYKDAGVDIDEANRSNSLIREHVRRTFDASVVTDMGAFAGVVSLEKLKKYADPVLVSSIDGVGTKLMVASMMGRWDTVGKDIVNHCANDILAMGAEPLFFLDYVATGKLDSRVMEQIVKGMSDACVENGMPLIAGETAEMPGLYGKGDHDVVGCIVGVAERSRPINDGKIKYGDVLVGLESSGLHTNGYSLARKVLFEKAGLSVSDKIGMDGSEKNIGEVLLEPHLSYSKAVLKLMEHVDIHGIAHITGGGFLENIPRILPEGLSVEIGKASMKVPPIFRLIQEKGSVPEDDMYRTFNMGIGLVLVLSGGSADDAVKRLEMSGHVSRVIGRVVKGESGVKLI